MRIVEARTSQEPGERSAADDRRDGERRTADPYEPAGRVAAAEEERPRKEPAADGEKHPTGGHACMNPNVTRVPGCARTSTRNGAFGATKGVAPSNVRRSAEPATRPPPPGSGANAPATSFAGALVSTVIVPRPVQPENAARPVVVPSACTPSIAEASRKGVALS